MSKVELHHFTSFLLKQEKTLYEICFKLVGSSSHFFKSIFASAHFTMSMLHSAVKSTGLNCAVKRNRRTKGAIRILAFDINKARILPNIVSDCSQKSEQKDLLIKKANTPVHK